MSKKCHTGAGLRAREHPAVYSDSVGLVSGGNMGVSHKGMHKRRSHTTHGSGLRAREHPAVYSDSVGLTTGGRGTKAGAKHNSWVQFVKAYHNQHGGTYREALINASHAYRGAGISASGGYGTKAGAAKNPWLLETAWARQQMVKHIRNEAASRKARGKDEYEEVLEA